MSCRLHFWGNFVDNRPSLARDWAKRPQRPPKRPPKTPRAPGPSPARQFAAQAGKAETSPPVILYRLLLSLAAPLILLRLLLARPASAAAHPGRWALLAERLGGGAIPDGPRPAGRRLWLHGASNGELASARALIETLRAQDPALPVLVTTNSTTARAMVAGWGLPGLQVALAPLDLRWVLRRFLARWQPGALVMVENEFWPNRLDMAARRGLPVLAVGARISARSARRWGKLPGLARRLLAAITYLSPQDQGSARAFAALGLDGARIGPVFNLKAAVHAQPDAAALAELAPAFPRALTLLAASTHPGEEAIVLEGFGQALRADPRRRLILAPRHPARGPEIARLIAAQGLGFRQRSLGAPPDADRPVYLADTLGEMPLWYALAGVSFVGGSLRDHGGHTPYEPAAQGSAILTGPHVANAAEAYATLARHQGAITVNDSAELAQALRQLDGPQAKAMAERARIALADTGAEATRAALARRILGALRR